MKDKIFRICHALGISCLELDPDMPVRIVKAGIADIHIFVKSKEVLKRTSMKKDLLMKITKELNVVGVHETYLEGENNIDHSFLIHSRNFAPLYGIDEECATGTSNAGLTALLYSDGKIKETQICKIIQGEYMGRVGRIYSKVLEGNNRRSVLVGGNAVYKYSQIAREEKE